VDEALWALSLGANLKNVPAELVHALEAEGMIAVLITPLGRQRLKSAIVDPYDAALAAVLAAPDSP
jgi:hypothetical protein